MNVSADFVVGRHPNGRICEVYEIVHCLAPSGELREAIHGSYASFFENGRIRSYALYRIGELDGMYSVWYPNGNLFYQCDYANGKRQGKLNIWYENGIKKVEGSYKDGIEHGRWIYWKENEEKAAEIVFENGKRVSGPEFRIAEVQLPEF